MLTEEVRRRYLAEYERRLPTTVSHAQAGRKATYGAALSLQAGVLAECPESGTDYMRQSVSQAMYVVQEHRETGPNQLTRD